MQTQKQTHKSDWAFGDASKLTRPQLGQDIRTEPKNIREDLDKRKKMGVIGAGIQPNTEKIKAAGTELLALNRSVGMGAPQQDLWTKSDRGRTGLGNAGLGAIIDLINNSKDNPVYNMDVIEQVRWGMLGPQSDASISANFGATIDLFGSGKSVQGIDFVETTMAQTGQTQTYFIACYLGFHVETEPMQWDTIGNAWTVPEVAASAIPASPDVWTAADAAALGFALEQPFYGQVLTPAVLQWGWWANYAAWHMVRGYNIRWKIGQHTNIMDEVLRHTAYMPPNAQDGSASDSEVDIVDFVNQMNARYVSMGSALIFLKTDFLRIGSNSAAGPTFPGVFTPTRDFDRVGATFGGMDLRCMLRGNSEFRKMTLPYVIKPGVPIGIFLQENDTDQGDQMRRAMSITNGLGGVVPPSMTEFTNIGTTAIATAPERTLDGVYPAPQSVLNLRTIFKGGDFKLSLMIKGFEVSEDWYNIMSQNADIREVVMAACGIRFATQGA
jgi:hypothetical protein